MTLPASGTISLSQYNVESGRTSTAAISMGTLPFSDPFSRGGLGQVLSLCNISSPAGVNPTVSLTNGYGQNSLGRAVILSSTGTAADINDVLWDGTQYVAVGNSAKVVVSSDGITWSSALSNGGLGIAKGVTLYVAVSGGVNNINTTTNPVTTAWTARTSGTGNTLNKVSWNGTRFVAVGNSGTIRVSTDGITWSGATSGVTTTLSYIVWNGAQFVVVGNTGTILTSPDGLTWTNRSVSIGINNLTGVAWGNSLFVAVGTGGKLFTSPDGITWTEQTSPIGAFQNFTGVAYGNGMFSATQNAFNFPPKVISSTNGITWIQRDIISYFFGRYPTSIRFVGTTASSEAFLIPMTLGVGGQIGYSKLTM